MQPIVPKDRIEEIKISNQENTRVILEALKKENIPLLKHIKGQEWCHNVKLCSLNGEFYPFRYNEDNIIRITRELGNNE